MSAHEPLRLLIVEHEEADAELAIAMLERAGFDVTSAIAGTPEDFTARLDEARWDVVLADYRLPGWTGMEALAILRARGDAVPLILVTGTLGEERAVECLLQGVADYILKTNLSRLPAAVRRARAEAASRAELARQQQFVRQLTLAVDQSPAAIFITDTDGSIEYVNERFVEATGYPREEAIGKNPRMLASGNTSRETYAALWTTLRAGRTWKGEIQNRRRDGGLFWDAVTISPLRDADGRTTHFVAVQEDITERRAITDELNRRDQRFRELAENISEVFFVIDAWLREVVYVNAAYERLWGRPVETLSADPLSFLEPMPDEDRARVLQYTERVRNGEDPGPIEFRLRQPDGSVRWALSHAAPVRDESGQVYRLSGFALDITERRLAKDALQASERRLRTLFETVNLIVLVLDHEGRVEYLNPYALRLTGYQPSEALGADWFKRFLAGPEQESMRAVFGELLGSGLHAHHRNTIRTKAGALRTISWHNTVLRDEQGAPTGSLSVGEDVTEHDKLEQQFRQSQKMEAVGRLAGGVAHDFNNLLTVIVSYAEMLRDQLEAGDPRHEDLDPILTAADAATALTRQLLAFSRQQVIQPREVRVEDVVAQSGKLLRRVIGEDVTLETRFGASGATVIIDPGQLDQVMMNLAVNARDAMPQGGTLTIATSTVDIEATTDLTGALAVSGPFVRLAVTDTGTGMDIITRDRIFEPFFTTKEAGKGTGLGLATVYGIIEQSKGFIRVDSEPGLGTTFGIFLPLVTQGAPATAATAAGHHSRGTETVLLVEDAAAVRTVTRKVLEACGYVVIEATTPKEALDIATRRAGPVHLLLTDVVMPEMSGRQLADAFVLLRPATRVLYMSGYTDDSILRHGVLDPGVNYLQKPFTREAIARKMREVLDA